MQRRYTRLISALFLQLRENEGDINIEVFGGGREIRAGRLLIFCYIPEMKASRRDGGGGDGGTFEIREYSVRFASKNENFKKHFEGARFVIPCRFARTGINCVLFKFIIGVDGSFQFVIS